MLKLTSGLLEYFVLIQVLVLAPTILMHDKLRKPILVYTILALIIFFVSTMSVCIKLYVLKPIGMEWFGITAFFLFAFGIVSLSLKFIFKRVSVLQGHISSPLYVAVLFALFLGSQLMTNYLSIELIDVMVNSIGIATIFFFTSVIISIAVKSVSKIYLPSFVRGYPITLIIAGIFVFVSGTLAHTVLILWREL